MSDQTPRFHLQRVFADGTKGAPEIVPVGAIPLSTQTGRRGFLTTVGVLSAGAAALASCGPPRSSTSQKGPGVKLRETGDDMAFGDACSAAISAHAASIRAIAFAPSGALLASADDKGLVKLWKIPENTLAATLHAHDGMPARAIAFSPDNNTVATCGEDGMIKLWSVQGKLIATLKGNVDAVYAIAFAPDGMTLASGGADKTIKLWDVATGAVKTSVITHTAAVSALAYAPDGKTFVSGGQDNLAFIWRADGTFQSRLAGHVQPINAVAFSADGKTIATGSSNGAVNLWAAADGAALKSIVDISPGSQASSVGSVVFSPNGSVLVSANSGTTRIWSLPDGKLKANLGSGYGTGAVTFHPGGELLATALGTDIVLWGLPRGGVTQRFPPRRPYTMYNTARVGGEGKVLVGSGDGGAPDIWSLPKGELLDAKFSVPPNTYGVQIALSASGKTLAIAAGNTASFYALPDMRSAGAIEWKGARPYPETAYGAGELRAIALQPDGQTIAVATGENLIRLWSTVSKKVTATIQTSTGVAARCLRYTPDGRYLIAGDPSGVVNVWTAQGALFKAFTNNTGPTRAIAISADSAIMAVVGEYGINFWRLPNGEKYELALKADQTGYNGISALAFNHDTSLLAAATLRGAVLWTMRDGVHRATLNATLSVRDVSFHPNGREIITATDIVEFWNLPAGGFQSCLFDRAALTSDQEVNQYKLAQASGSWTTFTQPCGTPIPPGATCTCNCVAGSAPSPNSYGGGDSYGGSYCTCNKVCVCMAV